MSAMRWGTSRKVIGVLYEEHENAALKLLGGSRITGITYLEKGSDDVRLLSASKFDANVLRGATATGVLYREQSSADVQLLAGSKLVGLLYEESGAPGLKLLRVSHTALTLVSVRAIKGLLYLPKGGAEVELLGDLRDLSAAAGAELVGFLYRDEGTDQ